MNAKEIRTATLEQFTSTVKELLKDNLVGFTKEKGENLLEFTLVNGQVFELRISEK